MQFLDIPEEVIIRSICPNVSYNDVLRLRHVNKQTKRYSDDHLKIRVANQEFEINERDKTLKKFMTLGVNASQIYFNVQSPHFFTDCQPDIENFLGKYGDKITHLRVAYFNAFSVDGEMDFYGALSNLRHLELEKVDATTRVCYELRHSKRFNNSPFPNNFKELETLKLGMVHGSSVHDWYYQWDFFDFCEKLVYFKHALDPNTDNGGNSISLDPFGSFAKAILERKVKYPNGPHLKYFDIQNTRENYSAYEDLIVLLRICVEHNIKLLNVDVCTLQFTIVTFEPLDLDEPIMSLRHVNPIIFFREMPNLEKISIDGICTQGKVRTDQNCYPEWPKLKVLEMTTDGLISMDAGSLKVMFDYLFNREEPREQLTELSMKLTTQFDQWKMRSIRHPAASSIVVTCPNLTKLTLANYVQASPNKAFSKLWEGLKFLEEICLEDCATLGNAGFIGRNVDKPDFLGLKHLKKLTLKGLEKMPNITDTFFKLVLRHMKLSHLVLQSDAPLVSISHEGISSLLTEEFGKSIEKFPFEEWSLSGVSEEDFQHLGFQFRSSYMI